MEKMRLPFAYPDRRILEPAIRRQDVIHNQFPFWLGIRAIGVARKAGIPVVSTFHVQAEHLLHNVGLRSPRLVDWTYRFFLRTTYDRSDAVLCPSAFAERELRRYGLKRPTAVISNGVPPNTGRCRARSASGSRGSSPSSRWGGSPRRSGTTSSSRPSAAPATRSPSSSSCWATDR